MDELQYYLEKLSPIQKLKFFTFWDIFFMLVFFIIIYFSFQNYAQKKYGDDAELKKIFTRGFLLKMFMGLGTAFMYDFYYKRVGDTFYYLVNSYALGEVLFKNPVAFFKIMVGNFTPETLYDVGSYGYTPHKDASIFMTHRLLAFFTLIGNNNYYTSTIILNAFLFIVNWKGFLFFRKLLPDKTKMLAIAFLYVPSVLFWSSGLFKDAFTYSFSIQFLVFFYKIFFQRKVSVFNILRLLFFGYVVFVIKTYILYSIVGAGFIWLGFLYIHRVESRVLRVIVFPVIMFGVGIGGAWMLSIMSQFSESHYHDVESMLDKAVLSQQDLKQDYYGGQSFDIGDYDASVGGALSVAPQAILAGLLRPFLWEARKVTMIFSGLENTFILYLFFIVFFRAGPMFFFKQLSKEPFLIFCFVHAITMSLGIGLSTSNFGALVRFRIPLVPFLVFGLLYVYDNYRNKHQEVVIEEETDLTKPLHEQFKKQIRKR